MTQEFASFFKKLINNTATDYHTIGSFFGINVIKIQRQSKKHLSSFTTWKPREHAHQWIIYGLDPRTVILEIKKLQSALAN